VNNKKNNNNNNSNNVCLTFPRTETSLTDDETLLTTTLRAADDGALPSLGLIVGCAVGAAVCLLVTTKSRERDR
jgi:hypothetical protein